jgi:hypothetical protein
MSSTSEVMCVEQVTSLFKSEIVKYVYHNTKFSKVLQVYRSSFKFLIDIRMYYENHPTRKGVRLTEDEYKWLMDLMVWKQPTEPIEREDRISKRMFRLIPQPEKNGYFLTTIYGDQIRSIFLFKNEMSLLLFANGKVLQAIEAELKRDQAFGNKRKLEAEEVPSFQNAFVKKIATNN